MASVTLIGGSGTTTIPFTTTQAAHLAQALENSLLAMVQDYSVTAVEFQGVQGQSTYPGGSGPFLAALSGNQFTTFDAAATPYISVSNTGKTIISNTQSVQTVVAGSGSLWYDAANPGTNGVPGAVVWKAGSGNNSFSVENGATAQFNIDGGTSYIDASQGTSTTTVFSGVVTYVGGDLVAPIGPSTVVGYTGQSTVNVGQPTGADSSTGVSTLYYQSGSAGGVINSNGQASVRLIDPSFGTTSVIGLDTVPLGQITLNVTGDANWLDSNGTSPTVNLSSGSLLLTNTLASSVVINPTGNVTIWGGLPTNNNSFADVGKTGDGSLKVNASTGSVTLFGGNGTGIVNGGSAGHNLLIGGNAPMTLSGGGTADTLWAGGSSGGSLLVASYGSTTLIGSQSNLGDTFVLGQVGRNGDPTKVGNDRVFGSTGADNFVLGSSSATISGDGGNDKYIDFSNHSVAHDAMIEITDFKLGSDILMLASSNGIDAAPSIVHTNIVGNNTLVTLTDGLSIQFDNIKTMDGNAFLKH